MRWVVAIAHFKKISGRTAVLLPFKNAKCPVLYHTYKVLINEQQKQFHNSNHKSQSSILFPFLSETKLQAEYSSPLSWYWTKQLINNFKALLEDENLATNVHSHYFTIILLPSDGGEHFYHL